MPVISPMISIILASHHSLVGGTLGQILKGLLYDSLKLIAGVFL